MPDTVSILDPDSQIGGLIRDLGKLAGTALATYGAVDANMANLITGILISALSIGWSRYNAAKATRFIAAASALPVGATRAEVKAEAGAPTVQPKTGGV